MNGQQRGGWNEGNEQTEREGARDAVAIESPATAITQQRREMLQAPVVFQRLTIRSDPFKPTPHGLLFHPPSAHYAVFVMHARYS